jgi:uncharacterized membrane protein
MAATKTQGKTFMLFMVGLTGACAGIAYSTTGAGKVALGIGLIAVAVSLFEFFKIKPLEGRIGVGPVPQPTVLKLAGILVVLLGWLVVLFGIHLTGGVGGRMVTSILGLAISLGGICFVLAPAMNKNAIWKA